MKKELVLVLGLLLITFSLLIAIIPSAYAVKQCTLDLPILGINNHEWIEDTYPISNDEEIAYAACMKAFELAGNKTCFLSTCEKYWTNGWSPGTGAYRFLIHSSSIGHTHDYGATGCDGGSDQFVFGYNTDAHSRLSHCMNPTQPGRIDMYYSGFWQGCHGTGFGTFDCEEISPYCGDGNCDEDENYDNCPEDCEQPPDYYTKEEVDLLIGNLQNEIDDIKEEQVEQNSKIESLSGLLYEFIETITSYFSYMPFYIKKLIVCGSMEANDLQEKEDLGLSCHMNNLGNQEVCVCKQ